MFSSAGCPASAAADFPPGAPETEYTMDRPFHIESFADAILSQNGRNRVRYGHILESLLLFQWAYDRVFECVSRQNYPSFIV